MRIDFHFRHMSASDELTNYVNEHLKRLEKFELNALRAQFTFTNEKSVKRVDIHVRGQDFELHATAEAENFLSGIDIALEKMARQLVRKKNKIKGHKAITAKRRQVS